MTKLKAPSRGGFSDISWLPSTVEDTFLCYLIKLERSSPSINIIGTSYLQVGLGTVGQTGETIQKRHFKVWRQWIPQWHSLEIQWLPVAMFKTSLSSLHMNVPSQIHIHMQHRQPGMVPKPTAPAIASGSAEAGVAGYLLERQTRRGVFVFFFLSIFTPSSAVFCGRKFGNGEKYSCKKK